MKIYFIHLHEPYNHIFYVSSRFFFYRLFIFFFVLCNFTPLNMGIIFFFLLRIKYGCAHYTTVVQPYTVHMYKIVQNAVFAFKNLFTCCFFSSFIFLYHSCQFWFMLAFRSIFFTILIILDEFIEIKSRAFFFISFFWFNIILFLLFFQFFFFFFVSVFNLDYYMIYAWDTILFFYKFTSLGAYRIYTKMKKQIRRHQWIGG